MREQLRIFLISDQIVQRLVGLPLRAVVQPAALGAFALAFAGRSAAGSAVPLKRSITFL